LSRVYEKYRADLLRLALSMLSDRASAEDVVQDVFVGFAGIARTFRLTGSLTGYLATCTANAARNRLKATSRRAAAGLDQAMNVACGGESPDEWAILSEEFRQVSSAMARLPAEQREVVTLHLYGDMTFREVAAWQKTSIKTVQSRYRYGLDKLRSIVKGEVTA
jgi:RNA polymerase sigma factor (sigma-70 family)